VFLTSTLASRVDQPCGKKNRRHSTGQTDPAPAHARWRHSSRRAPRCVESSL